MVVVVVMLLVVYLPKWKGTDGVVVVVMLVIGMLIDAIELPKGFGWEVLVVEI